MNIVLFTIYVMQGYYIRMLQCEVQFYFSKQLFWYFFFVDCFLGENKAWILFDDKIDKGEGSNTYRFDSVEERWFVLYFLLL